MTKRNNALLTEFVDSVWNRGDVSNLPAYLCESYTIHHDPGDPWEHRTLSRAEFAERVRISRSPVPDQAFDVLTMFAQDDKVCLTWLWSGTHSGSLAGFEGTGEQLLMSGATVYYFVDGKVSGHWQVTDRAGIYRQLVHASI